MTIIGKKDSPPPVRKRTGLDAVSAVRMSEHLTAAVDAWAEAYQMARSDAICKLVEYGLQAAPPVPASIGSSSLDIEELAVKQLDQLIDPELPADERERRIRRLTEGPPEFSRERIDLPKHKD
jgi:hypothetical protein